MLENFEAGLDLGQNALGCGHVLLDALTLEFPAFDLRFGAVQRGLSFFPPTVTFPILKGLARINLGSLHAGGGGVTPHDGVFDQPGSPDRGTVVRLQGDPRVLDQLGAV